MHGQQILMGATDTIDSSSSGGDDDDREKKNVVQQKRELGGRNMAW